MTPSLDGDEQPPLTSKPSSTPLSPASSTSSFSTTTTTSTSHFQSPFSPTARQQQQQLLHHQQQHRQHQSSGEDHPPSGWRSRLPHLHLHRLPLLPRDDLPDDDDDDDNNNNNNNNNGSSSAVYASPKGDDFAGLATVHKLSLLVFVAVCAFFLIDIRAHETVCDGRISRGDFARDLAPPCDDAVTRASHARALRSTLEASLSAAGAPPGLRAGLLRAAFHDCVTASRDHPRSGCNGSIRLSDELAHPRNARLRPAIAAVAQARADVLQRDRGVNEIGTLCVGFADALQLAAAVAVRQAGGPDVTDRVVCPNAPRRDADVPDTSLNTTLLGSRARLARMGGLFSTLGLPRSDLLVALAGAHNFGGEAVSASGGGARGNNNGGRGRGRGGREGREGRGRRGGRENESGEGNNSTVTRLLFAHAGSLAASNRGAFLGAVRDGEEEEEEEVRVVRFSNDSTDRVWSGFAMNLVAMADRGDGKDLAGFHSMRSDRRLVEQPEAVRRLRVFAEDEDKVKKEFGEFLVRMGGISGEAMARGVRL